MKKILVILIILVITIPSFFRMLKPGIFSTQDFHLFRLAEFDKCISDFQIPCRWAPDAGAGFGEPVFNFYGQLSYTIGESFHLAGFSKIDSIKILFILSLALSAISMFALAKKIWGDNLSALLSSVIYIYAPYRAVDIWVRGALPEAFCFILFPLVILQIENYLEKQKKKNLLLFGLFFAILILTHNLSVILFLPFLVIWTIYRLFFYKKPKLLINLAFAAVFSFLISSFYLLPVIFESKFINLQSTTLGFFDWRAHFVTLNQLFISRFWGYGASVWGPEDGLSLSVGQIQWTIPIIILAFVLFKLFKSKSLNEKDANFLVIFSVGVLALFLTHNKSTFLWNHLSFLSFIQFPWRFLGLAVFSFSLASGELLKYIKIFKIPIYLIVIFTVILLNFQFFREDIWFNVKDTDTEIGSSWTESKFASLPDYWPKYGPLPTKEAPSETDDIKLISKKSSTQTFELKNINKQLEFPISYFPGWQISYNGKNINPSPSQNGLISAYIPDSPTKEVFLTFKNTSVRTIGNLISLISIISWIVIFIIKYEA
ncbi:MAG: glycosyltransferase family 39 protein [Candidatus Woesebacteria bacterium]|nr:MAG: glycosyltransferase family 39 protein [Candidatus Woesebacteria bacterium]